MNNSKEQKPDAAASKGDATRPNRDVSQEPVQITDKDVIKARDTGKPSSTPRVGPDDPKPPLHAANKGNDDFTSQPPRKNS